MTALRGFCCECAARACGIAAATIGCLGLLGWVLDVEVLKGVFTGGVTMVLWEDGRFVHTRCFTRDAFYGVFDTATIHHGGAGTFSRRHSRPGMIAVARRRGDLTLTCFAA